MQFKKYILLIFCVCIGIVIQAQTKYKDEAEMIKAATSMFDNKEYGK